MTVQWPFSSNYHAVNSITVGFMEPNISGSTSEQDLEGHWRLRQGYWRRNLGRLRLGVEPIEEQLARYRRVTWTLTAVPSILGLFFLALFTVFGRPDIGLVLVAILLLPIVLGAWWDYAMMARRARRYRQEADDYHREKERLRGAGDG
jgi:hypothetical protein